MASAWARELAAQAWRRPFTKDIELDPLLAEAFAQILDERGPMPMLGLATTRELLNEIAARIEVDGKLDYKTVGGEK